MIYLTKNVLLLVSTCCLFWSCQSTSTETATKTQKPRAKDTEAITSFAQWFNDPKPLVSAHRGGPYPGFPENAIETFQNIADQTSALIECDILMTKDSVLVLLHDDTLDRTTTGKGKVADLTYNQLKELQLVDNEGETTSFRIPTLDEVLAWGKGKVLFTLDVKRGVPFPKVIAAIEKFDAASYAAIITYRINDAKLVYSLNKNLIISVSASSKQALEQIVKSGIPVKNLLGFVGTREPDQAHYREVQKLGIKTILGTLGNLDNRAATKGNDKIYLTYVENGANILATDRPLEVARVLRSND